MSEVIELNREEIKRLSNMDDLDGHAWALYILLKQNMNIYTGIVQVELKVLTKVFLDRFQFKYDDKYINHITKLINLLLGSEIISCFSSSKEELLSLKLPLAISETCLELEGQH